jgi:hypothetical protein
MTDHVDNPPELIDPAPCDCCGVPSSYRRGSMWHGRDLICKACFFIWYDGPANIDMTNREQIKAERLRLYGTRDFQRWETPWL